MGRKRNDGGTGNLTGEAAVGPPPPPPKNKQSEGGDDECGVLLFPRSTQGKEQSVKLRFVRVFHGLITFLKALQISGAKRFGCGTIAIVIPRATGSSQRDAPCIDTVVEKSCRKLQERDDKATDETRGSMAPLEIAPCTRNQHDQSCCKLRSECSQAFVSSMSFVQLSVRFASLAPNVTRASCLGLRVVMPHCDVEVNSTGCWCSGLSASESTSIYIAQVRHELTITATRELPGAL